MKQRLAIVLMACAAITAAAPRAARAQVQISAGIQINSPSDFYQPLTPYGSWMDVGSYGRCWHPNGLAADWQPYTDGSWEWTDAGWYWQSDQPWAWACFHYGSWYDDSSDGWVWIPGTEWAPAWVNWRDSDDYIGWAPCGPGRSVLASRFFTFCDIHHFQDHFDRHNLIENDSRIINRTRVISDFHQQTVDFNGHQRAIFANRGPGVDPIERATGKKFTARPVRDVVQQTGRTQDAVRSQRSEPNRNQEQRTETPSPTGREQQRTYQQPEQRAPETPREQRPQTPAPTGREQQRNYQEPQPSQRPAPEVRPQSPEVAPPTREQPRVSHETPAPNFAPEQKRQAPSATPRAATPSERALPPTGRDQAPSAEHRQAAPPAAHPAPAPAQGRDDGHGHDGNKDDH
jgi:hypothetical protein